MPPYHQQCSISDEKVRRGTYGTFLSLVETQGRVPHKEAVTPSGQVIEYPGPAEVYHQVSLPPSRPLEQLLEAPPPLIVTQTAVSGCPPSVLVVRKRRVQPHRVLIACPKCRKIITHLKRRMKETSCWVLHKNRRSRKRQESCEWNLFIRSDLQHYCPKCAQHLGTFRYKTHNL